MCACQADRSGSTSDISTNKPLHTEVYKKGAADNSNNKAAAVLTVVVVAVAVSCYVVDKKR